MKLLIINNATKHLGEIEKLLGSHTHIYDIAEYGDIPESDLDKYDAFILSGGSLFSVEGNGEILHKEIKLIQNSTKPIFGICFGFELIAHVFGAKLEYMEAKENGVLDIDVLVPDDLFLGIDKFSVYEAHRFVVRESPPELMILAKSKDGVEAVKHTSLPIYGVQFHPEVFIDQVAGKEIFENFLKIAQK